MGPTCQILFFYSFFLSFSFSRSFFPVLSHEACIGAPMPGQDEVELNTPVLGGTGERDEAIPVLSSLSDTFSIAAAAGVSASMARRLG